MERRERSYRGISERAAVGYLENLGGEQVADEQVEGDGWQASLSSETVSVGGSLKLTEVTVVFEGDPGTVEDIVGAFSQKAIRAGG